MSGTESSGDGPVQRGPVPGSDDVPAGASDLVGDPDAPPAVESSDAVGAVDAPRETEIPATEVGGSADPAVAGWPPMAYWVRVTLTVVVTLLVVAAARQVTHVILLVIIAFVLAVGLDPPVRWLGQMRVSRGWAVTLIFVGLALFLALFVLLLVPPLVRQVEQFATALPGYLTHLQSRNDWIGNASRHANVSDKFQKFISDIPSHIGQSFGAIIGVAGTVLGRIFDLFTVSILSIYFMLSLPRLRLSVAAFTKPERRAQVDSILERSLEKIGGYVSGNLITSAFCGVAAVIALLALRVPYAVPLGLWAGVADLIPSVGSYLGAIPAILVALARGPIYGIATAGYFILYQQFENYVLAPRVYKNSIDLSPAAVIVSTLVGGTLAGFAGALLALPVAATIKVIMVDVVLVGRIKRPAAPAAPTTPATPRKARWGFGGRFSRRT